MAPSSVNRIEFIPEVRRVDAYVVPAAKSNAFSSYRRRYVRPPSASECGVLEFRLTNVRDFKIVDHPSRAVLVLYSPSAPFLFFASQVSKKEKKVERESCTKFMKSTSLWNFHRRSCLSAQRNRSGKWRNAAFHLARLRSRDNFRCFNPRALSRRARAASAEFYNKVRRTSRSISMYKHKDTRLIVSETAVARSSEPNRRKLGETGNSTLLTFVGGVSARARPKISERI